MEIHHVEKIQETPVIPLCVEYWADMMRRGLIGGGIPFSWEMNAFYAEEDGKVVGFLIYKVQEWDHCLFISHGYVQPAYRGRGIYRALWEKAVELAREKQLISITGITHWENKEMQAVMERLGRKPASIGYEYRLDARSD